MTLPVPGEVVGGYRVVETIGRGNMGVVYRAHDPAGRLVALKFVLLEAADEEAFARFQSEGEAMAAIPSHRNVLQVHSAGSHRGSPYLAMDFIEGSPLSRLMKGQVPPDRAVHVVERIASALQHVHASGVLHRDLKPDNIMIRADDGEPVIMDFGLARLAEGRGITRTGDIFGTPLYMAPEQILGLRAEVDARTDVWALGAILYHLLSGLPPFQGSSVLEMASLITTTKPAALSKSGAKLDPGLEEVVWRALAKERDQRFQSAAELASALRLTRTGVSDEAAVSSSSRWPLILVAVAGAVLIGGAGANWLFGQRAEQRIRQSALALEKRVERMVPGPRGGHVKARDLELLRRQVDALRAEAGPAAVPEELLSLEANLARAELEVALAGEEFEAAQGLLDQLVERAEHPVLAARLARAKGEPMPVAELRALAGSGQRDLARAARFYLALALADERPEEALEILSSLTGREELVERRKLELLVAVEKGQSGKLRELLRNPDTEPVRSRGLDRALARVDAALAEPGDRPLLAALEVVGVFRQEAGPHPLADRVLERVFSVVAELTALRLSKRSLAPQVPRLIELLNGLGEARLHVADRVTGGVLADALLEARGVGDSMNSLSNAQWGEIQVALTRIDAPFWTPHFMIVTTEFPARGTVPRYLSLRQELARAHKRNALAKAPKVVNSLVELLEKDQAGALGPRQRAWILLVGSDRDPPLRPEARLELLDRAVALDPNSPWVRVGRVGALVALSRQREATDEAELATGLFVSNGFLRRGGFWRDPVIAQYTQLVTAFRGKARQSDLAKALDARAQELRDRDWNRPAKED